jgi:hypothetical protein
MEIDHEAVLRERVAQLERENSTLRGQVESHASAVPDEKVSSRRPRGPGWTVLAAVLIVLGCLMAPLAVVSSWAKATLTETDAFVATYAPLARNPEVQSFVVDQVAAAIDQNVNLDQYIVDVVDGIKALGTRPRASAALDALTGTAIQSVQTVVRNRIEDFVASEAFAQSWERALRVSHTQLLATLSNDPQALIAAQSDGTIGIQLGPIVDDVKADLIARGLSVASRIPQVDRTIPIAQSDQIPAVQTAYRTVIAVGSWLPWVALVFLAVGVLVARRRSVALVWAALGLGLSMLLLVLGFTIGRGLLLATVPPAVVPAAITGLLYDTATAAMHDTAVIGVVLAVSIAVVAWFAGPFRASRRLRSFYTDGVAALRHNAERHGVTTGRVGEWTYAQRRVLHVIIALAASAAVVLLRPLSVSDIVGTVAVAVLALVLVTLIERPKPAVPLPPTGEPAAA